MQRQPHQLVLDERKEPEGAVPRPLHEHALSATADPGLDERRGLAEHLHPVAVRFQKAAVLAPALAQGLFRVVKEVYILRPARSPEQLV